MPPFPTQSSLTTLGIRLELLQLDVSHPDAWQAVSGFLMLLCSLCLVSLLTDFLKMWRHVIVTL